MNSNASAPSALDSAIHRILDIAGARVFEGNTVVPVACTPNGFKLVSMEEYLPAPSRIRQGVRLHRSDDFVAYVNRFKRTESVIFIAPDLALKSGAAIATALIDYHDAALGSVASDEKPSWNTHTAALVVEASPEYALLSAIDGKRMESPEFAERIRDLARYCTSHDAATLLELAHTINLTSKGQFASSEDQISGSMRLVYDVQVQASAGTQEKKLDVPNQLTFAMPMLLGGPKVTIVADLIYSIPRERGGKVLLGIRLPERRWQELETIEATATALSEATGLLTMVGAP